MTTVTFFMEGERIYSFEVRGHSGYAEEGADIVCAAVSSAVNLVHATVNEVMGLAASVKVEGAEVSFRLPGGLSELDEATCQNLLVGMMVYLTDLHEQYPAYLQVVVSDPGAGEESFPDFTF